MSDEKYNYDGNTQTMDDATNDGSENNDEKTQIIDGMRNDSEKNDGLYAHEEVSDEIVERWK